MKKLCLLCLFSFYFLNAFAQTQPCPDPTSPCQTGPIPPACDQYWVGNNCPCPPPETLYVYNPTTQMLEIDDIIEHPSCIKDCSECCIYFYCMGAPDCKLLATCNSDVQMIFRAVEQSTGYTHQAITNPMFPVQTLNLPGFQQGNLLISIFEPNNANNAALCKFSRYYNCQ